MKIDQLIQNCNIFKITNINNIVLQVELFIEDGILYNCSVYYINKMKMNVLIDMDIEEPATSENSLNECLKKCNKIIKCEDCDKVHLHSSYLKKDLCSDCSYQRVYNSISKGKMDSCNICTEQRLKSMMKECNTCNNHICSYCVKKMDCYCPFCRSFDLFV